MIICLLHSCVYYNLNITQSSNLELHTNFVYILLNNSRLFSLSRSLIKWKERRYIALKNVRKKLILKKWKPRSFILCTYIVYYNFCKATFHDGNKHKLHEDACCNFRRRFSTKHQIFIYLLKGFQLGHDEVDELQMFVFKAPVKPIQGF